MFTYNKKAIKRVGFLGLGKSNLGVLEYLLRHNRDLLITVRNRETVDISKIKCERAYFGEQMLSEIDEDILFLSPSARRDSPEILKAEAKGVILSSDAGFFFDNSDADVYAVTGSDGKSTTSYLTSQLLSESYSSVLPFGNIGEPMTPHLDDKPDSAFVAELSSFQLMYLKPRSERCVITNITKNHLNWHTSFEEYANAKGNVLKNAKQTVLNFDCEVTRTLLEREPFAVFSRKFDENEIRSRIKAQLYVTEKNAKIFASGEEMLDTEKILVGANHNVYNFMAAIAMSYGRCTKEKILHTAESFGGLPHRCEFVGKLNGVSYYDSSIDSSPKRCVATLDMFSERVILILGGRSKGLDFSELIPTLIKKTKLIILTGECAEEIEESFELFPTFRASQIPYVKVLDFFDAVEYAIKKAEPNDNVLLSPAATSYDKFKNFEQRGDAFKRVLKTKGI